MHIQYCYNFQYKIWDIQVHVHVSVKHRSKVLVGRWWNFRINPRNGILEPAPLFQSQWNTCRHMKTTQQNWMVDFLLELMHDVILTFLPWFSSARIIIPVLPNVHQEFPIEHSDIYKPLVGNLLCDDIYREWRFCFNSQHTAIATLFLESHHVHHREYLSSRCNLWYTVTLSALIYGDLINSKFIKVCEEG